jgi:glucose/arabinose dehydrogenase
MTSAPARRLLAAAAVLLAASSSAWAQLLTTVRIASGLSRPVFVVSPPGDNTRLFIVEQRGSAGVADRADIRILNLATNVINSTPFLSISGLGIAPEQGLLCLAFDPGYDTNGFFYITYSDAAMTMHLTRVHVSADPNVADPASAAPVLTQSHPFFNHYSGWIDFGPDGFLYVAMGDGGSACDPFTNAQNLSSLLGKMLRIDVSTLPYAIPPDNPFVGQAGARPEIWAYGLRNPWRDSFDRLTGDLYIADVGQDVQEEVDVNPAGVGGRNYGWNCREGLTCSTDAPSNCTLPSLCPSCVIGGAVDPIHAYSHDVGCCIIGGYVYRGAAMPWLRGAYFFADYCTSTIWSFRYVGQPITTFFDRTAELAVPGRTIDQISSFGEGATGELYIVDQGGGEIYRIIPRCRANCDGSTTPPILDINDFVCFIDHFMQGDPYCNCDHSTTPPVLNIYDFICYQHQFSLGCP